MLCINYIRDSAIKKEANMRRYLNYIMYGWISIKVVTKRGKFMFCRHHMSLTLLATNDFCYANFDTKSALHQNLIQSA